MLSIALQTSFVPDAGDIAELRKALRGSRDAEDITGVKNPWRLAPWRTFPDVAQPMSPWVPRFRQRDGRLAVGLFETGNAGWVLEAVSGIADHLRKKLPHWTVLG